MECLYYFIKGMEQFIYNGTALQQKHPNSQLPAANLRLIKSKHNTRANLLYCYLMFDVTLSDIPLSGADAKHAIARRDLWVAMKCENDSGILVIRILFNRNRLQIIWNQIQRNEVSSNSMGCTISTIVQTKDISYSL